MDSALNKNIALNIIKEFAVNVLKIHIFKMEYVRKLRIVNYNIKKIVNNVCLDIGERGEMEKKMMKKEKYLQVSL